jgi:ankyrin repeat protein
LAAQHGQVEIVRLLLDAGEDPNRYNPVGGHSHCTPLHQAAGYGPSELVRNAGRTRRKIGPQGCPVARNASRLGPPPR